MDGFDDLLAPSRQALEDNPFADPFGKRSSSPDPWGTPFASNDPSENAFGSSEDHFGSSELSYGSTLHDETASSTVAEETLPSDPLDYATHHTEDDDDNKPLANPRSPGFRESVPAAFSETATIRPDHIEEFDKHTAPAFSTNTDSTTSAAEASKPDTVSTPLAQPPLSPSLSTSGFGAAPSATASGFRTPLDAPFPGLERSVAALSLGGEAVGGWQSEEQTPWQTEAFPSAHPTPTAAVAAPDDDSDDDKPILQAYHKQHDPESSPLVSSSRSLADILILMAYIPAHRCHTNC